MKNNDVQMSQPGHRGHHEPFKGEQESVPAATVPSETPVPGAFGQQNGGETADREPGAVQHPGDKAAEKAEAEAAE